MKEKELKHQISEKETKEKEVLMNALKSQYEVNISKMKNELEQLKKENEKQLDQIKEIATEKRYLFSISLLATYLCNTFCNARIVKMKIKSTLLHRDLHLKIDRGSMFDILNIIPCRSWKEESFLTISYRNEF